MENPITKFAPFLVGEFPKPFQELLDKVTSNEPLTKDDLKKELWGAYELVFVIMRDKKDDPVGLILKIIV